MSIQRGNGKVREIMIAEVRYTYNYLNYINILDELMGLAYAQKGISRFSFYLC